MDRVRGGVKVAIYEKEKKSKRKCRTCGTTLLIGRENNVVPSTMTEIEQSERKLEKRLQREGVKPKEGSLANRALCQTLSKTLEMSRAIIKDSPKFLERKTRYELGKIKDHQSISLYGNHIGDLIEKNEI